MIIDIFKLNIVKTQFQLIKKIDTFRRRKHINILGNLLPLQPVVEDVTKEAAEEV